MKVTALIDEALINQVKKISGGKNITESITIALKEYVKYNKMEMLYDSIQKKPLTFQEGFVPYKRSNKR